MTTINNEEWRDVPGFEGRYQASNLGRVRSLHNKHGQRPKPLVLKPGVNYMGYHRLTLMADDGSRNSIFVHRIVMLTFVGEPEGGQQVNHINGNPREIVHLFDRFGAYVPRAGERNTTTWPIHNALLRLGLCASDAVIEAAQELAKRQPEAFADDCVCCQDAPAIDGDYCRMCSMAVRNA